MGTIGLEWNCSLSMLSCVWNACAIDPAAGSGMSYPLFLIVCVIAAAHICPCSSRVSSSAKSASYLDSALVTVLSLSAMCW